MSRGSITWSDKEPGYQGEGDDATQRFRPTLCQKSTRGFKSPPGCFVTMGKLLNLSVFQIPHP